MSKLLQSYGTLSEVEVKFMILLFKQITLFFSGKTVVRLEYEAYIPMARSEMRKICKQVREKWDVIKIAIFHRIG